MRLYLNYLLLQTAFCLTILTACLSTSTNCGMHEFVSDGDIPFQEKLWQRGFFKSDSFKMKNSSEQYSSSIKLVRTRETMVCSLVSLLGENKFRYEQIVSILGEGEATNAQGSLYSNPADQEWGWSKFGYHLPEKVKNKEALIYYVGYNASGDCYLVIAFNDGRYGHSLRVFAY